MAASASAQVGLIGLGVMGENLALNIERNGYTIAVFNRHVDKVDAFVNGAAKGKNVIGCRDEKSFCESLQRPRKIILLVKAGQPVDDTVAKLKPYLQEGDIIIDGGNSHFNDTRKREAQLKTEGINFIGSGVSGGEEGALWGPSLMPGGDKKAYEAIAPIWEKVAAKVNGEPCVTYLGPDGAGHFVKMVHNGIEYGDMQLLAECYDILRRGLGLDMSHTADIFDRWNQGVLNSFLVEITAKVLTVIDDETKKPLVDLILDKAGQKGTGKWTTEAASELGVPIPTIDAAWSARLLSGLKDERVKASRVLMGPKPGQSDVNQEPMIKALETAFYCGRICSYAQGMAIIQAGSKEYNWGTNLAEVAKIWRGGCIIRSKTLETIMQAFSADPNLPNLMMDASMAKVLAESQDAWRQVVAFAQSQGIPIPAMSASLAYYDSYRSERLPQNLTQAQRDLFGAHTYERMDKPQAGPIHTEWEKLAKVKTKAESK